MLLNASNRFKAFKGKFWFLRASKDIKIFKGIQGHVGGMLSVYPCKYGETTEEKLMKLLKNM